MCTVQQNKDRKIGEKIAVDSGYNDFFFRFINLLRLSRCNTKEMAKMSWRIRSLLLVNQHMQFTSKSYTARKKRVPTHGLCLNTESQQNDKSSMHSISLICTRTLSTRKRALLHTHRVRKRQRFDRVKFNLKRLYYLTG